MALQVLVPGGRSPGASVDATHAAIDPAARAPIFREFCVGK